MQARPPLSVEKKDEGFFDIICAGEALWEAVEERTFLLRSRPAAVQPRGGAVKIALALASMGRRVGLSTVLPGDAFGHLCNETIASLGVDTGGVRFAHSDTGLSLYAATMRALQVGTILEPGLEVPAAWNAGVFFLSGLAPQLSVASQQCLAVRAARRRNMCVFLDIAPRPFLWHDQDPRRVSAVLREADIVRCTLADLGSLGHSALSVRKLLRDDSVLVISDDLGRCVAQGPWGTAKFSPPDPTASPPRRIGDAITTALCLELTSFGVPAALTADGWTRAFEQGYRYATETNLIPTPFASRWQKS